MPRLIVEGAKRCEDLIVILRWVVEVARRCGDLVVRSRSVWESIFNELGCRHWACCGQWWWHTKIGYTTIENE